ncbi:MAG: LuxR C-terminal-related transcriptional regulator [Peptococcaceae bacterium]
MTKFPLKTGNLNERVLSVVVFSLLFAWVLAFPFEGQILYALTGVYQIEPHHMVFGAIAAQLGGLFLGGFFIKTIRAAKRFITGAVLFCIALSAVFLLGPSVFWLPALVAGSFLSGGSVAAWGFYFRSGSRKGQRIKTAADGLAYSNILMILLNIIAVYISPELGLIGAMLCLVLALVFLRKLPEDDCTSASPFQVQQGSPVSMAKPLAFLCLFVVIITINSGLMYQVQGPAFSHLKWLTGWYWAIPYIAALMIVRNLPEKTNRSYLLYVAIAMIGFSFIFFWVLDRSAPSYLVVDTLMLGACGIYDLFWWSILGEMLDFERNAAKILGIGLSANVLGVLLGGTIGNAITTAGLSGSDATLLALAVVCVTLVLLPPLHTHLTMLLKTHAFLTVFSALPQQEQNDRMQRVAVFTVLSQREMQVSALLLQGKTYKVIAGELFISENTVKYYVKNIYSKLHIQSRAQLIELVSKQKNAIPRP